MSMKASNPVTKKGPMQDNRMSDKNYPVLKNTQSFLNLLKIYHRHEVYGMNNIPKSGAGILITNHSLATYDGFMLGLAIYEKTGRLVKGLGDRLLFKLPVIREYVSKIGLYNASMSTAHEILEQGEILALAPGGMREALRPSQKKYQIEWQDRTGFARLSLETQTPIILAACPKADEIFNVYKSPLTQIVYDKFKIPLPIFRGIGPSLIPRPVHLVHHIGEIIRPPLKENYSPEEFEKVIKNYHQRIVISMKKLMKKSLKYA